MNARLIKETRDLLPVFAGALLLMVVPFLLVPHVLQYQLEIQQEVFCYLALGVACVMMAGSSFGNEFHCRTVPLLLSQPIRRSVLWRDKMLVLGAGMATSLVVLLVCWAVCCPGQEVREWGLLIFIPLCAFCGAPCWTLLLRHGIGGMVAAVAAPFGILAAYALVVEQLGGNESAAVVTGMLSLLFIYCALAYWLGYARFKRLEAVDRPSRELSLPAGLETSFVQPLTRVAARFHSPFATLLKKEFRLQQISFLLVGLFFLIAVAGACLVKLHHGLAEAIVGFDCMIYVLILPLIAGAISVAEEKGWDLAEWHLTLPPSALKQWSAKMLAALSTSLALGLLLPTAVFLAGGALFSQPGSRASLPPAPQILCWLLGQLLLTSVAIYAASFAKNTLRAILAAFVIITVVGGGATYLASQVVVALADDIALRLVPLLASVMGPRFFLLGKLFHSHQVQAFGLILGFMLCLMQWFAWSNFRRHQLSAVRLLVQFTVIFVSFYLMILAFDIMQSLAWPGGR